MPILRLKRYTNEIYTHYLRLSEEPTVEEENTSLGKRLRNSYAMTAQTVLFFNQPVEDMPIEKWCDEVPVTYQLKIDDFLSVLEDSTRWAVSALDMKLVEPETLKQRLLVDIPNLRIHLLNEHEDDAITSQFEKTCRLVHDEIEDNLRKRKTLVRLIWAYIQAKELTAMARDLSSCNRLEYLRRLTKY